MIIFSKKYVLHSLIPLESRVAHSGLAYASWSECLFHLFLSILSSRMVKRVPLFQVKNKCGSIVHIFQMKNKYDTNATIIQYI